MKRSLILLSLLVASSPVLADTLQVGANIGNVPWEFEDANGDYVGFEVELIQEIAGRLGHEVEIVNIPFQGLFSAVQSGRIDAAISSITITEERLASVSFAQPYYDSDQSLTTTTESGVMMLSDLEDKVVGVDSGSTGDIWTTEHQEEHGIAEIRRYEGLQPAMLDLAAGRIDGYISDIPALQYYTKDKPNLIVVERIPTGEQYSIMFAKDSPLTSQFNAVITELKEEYFLPLLHEKWFGALPEDETSTASVAEMPATQ